MTKKGWIVGLGPGGLLVITLGQFALLLLLLLGFNYGWLNLDSLPVIIGGVLPIVVPWGAALGGICIALVSITAHWAKWDAPADGRPSAEAKTWNGWLLVRMPLGAALGTVAVLIVVLLLGTIGADAGGGVAVSPTGAATLMAVAFIVGYRQETFRDLVARSVDVILGPGTPAKNESISLDTAKVDFPQTPVNGSSDQAVQVSNLGRKLLVLPSSQVTVTKPFSVTTMPGNLAGGGTGSIGLSFRPTDPGSYSGTLTVTADGGTRTVELTGRTP